ncbi:DUF1661 domain-containing protein [Porphyromonas gulae]|uniref:DUF1661 domain-containing protein n=1 Tax=Porphyromonas gulae TaxID=111105 RepID=UPI001E52CCC1|nr:DUF1661 domain-containing protein [Porphyromonas gulae]
MARKIFTSRTKTKKFPRHVLRNTKQLFSRTRTNEDSSTKETAVGLNSGKKHFQSANLRKYRISLYSKT